MKQTRLVSIPVLAAVALGAAAASALADGSVDLQLRGKDKVADPGQTRMIARGDRLASRDPIVEMRKLR